MSATEDAGALKAAAWIREEDVRGIRVSKPAFVKSYDKAARSLARNLDRFLENPDEDGVHDARTAMRRVEAHLSLLPGRVRKDPEVKELLKKQGRAMKRSAKVRDLDVIRGRVSRHGRAADELLLRIDKRRRTLVKEARDAAASARGLALPSANSRDVTEARLQRRFEKVVGRLKAEIDELLPIVARDPANLKGLHRLRIDCKKLRYTLEAASAGRSTALPSLEMWQDALGSIHDWDMTIAYLGEDRSLAADEILKKGIKERGREFQAFARSLGVAAA